MRGRGRKPQQHGATMRDSAVKEDAGTHRKLVDSKNSNSLTRVCFAVSMRLVLLAGDDDEHKSERDDAVERWKRRLEECLLGELSREKGWKMCVVAKSGAGHKATSSNRAEYSPNVFAGKS